ncbi:MAG: M23 family metallopeptidase [Clostridia bacterium]|nr:M23 family metallopeptidase [Clostridia bacterium]
MERKGKSGIYITVCSLAVIAAVIGFAGKRNKKEELPKKVVESIPEVQQVQTVESETKPQTKEKNISVAEEATVSVSKAAKVNEAKFVRPVNGKVIEEFSDNNLIYNEALRDWRTHNGVDLEAESGTQVIAAANGIVENVFDSNMGMCVLIDHQNGYKTVYANLDDSIAVKKGDEVAEGDVIGIVGNTALGDATDLPHLHFEITKDGENVNPTEYIE